MCACAARCFEPAFEPAATMRRAWECTGHSRGVRTACFTSNPREQGCADECLMPGQLHEAPTFHRPLLRSRQHPRLTTPSPVSSLGRYLASCCGLACRTSCEMHRLECAPYDSATAELRRRGPPSGRMRGAQRRLVGLAGAPHHCVPHKHGVLPPTSSKAAAARRAAHGRPT